MNATFPPHAPYEKPVSKPLPQPSLPLEIWGATDKGRQREGNEDSIYPHSGTDMFTPNQQSLAQKGHLLLVADGVGGARAGAEASRWAVRVAVERYYDLPGPSLGNDLRTAIEMANASLYQYLQSTGIPNAGCTMAAALIHNNILYIANVGDSRVYLIRNGYITQLTHDHTLAQQKADQGLIRPEQVALDPDSNVLTRSLGSSPTVRVDLLQPQPLAPGDVVLVCSDGLTDMVAVDRIPQLISDAPLQKAAQRLIEAANRAGGVDNISVVLARVGGKAAAVPVKVKAARPERGAKHPWLFAVVGLGAVLLFALIALLSFVYYTRGRAGKSPSPPAVATATAPPTAVQALPGTEIVPPTDTVPPGHPTSTPRPTSTPVPSPSPRPGQGGKLTPTGTAPAQAVNITLLAPEAGSTTGNPVSFRWEGELEKGQTYQAVALHPESGYTLRSGSLDDPRWETHLPGEKFGQWRWWVEVIEDGKVVGRSAEWMFWFQPVQVGPGPTEPTPTLPR
ncbi:MAG: protein phosphatase 2C domain-containing protein [Anaerolineae bacterium]|nr:protein phosphatase 2C domain-containing protein [Anaerolineae bacterium]